MKKLVSVNIFAAICFLSITAFAQSKVAYVNSQKILEELPDAQKVQKELDAMFKGWKEEMEKMDQELKQGFADYQKKKDLMKQEAKDAEERRLTDLQQRMRDYEIQKRGEAAKENETKLGPIRERVLKAIEQVAKEDGFTFVFDKAGDNLLLFADAKFDLTYKVIDRLKRGAAVPKSTK